MAGTEGEVWGHGLCWSLTVFWWLIYTKQQSHEHLHTPSIRLTLSLLSCSHFTALSTKQSTGFGFSLENEKSKNRPPRGPGGPFLGRQFLLWALRPPRVTSAECTAWVWGQLSRGLALGNVFTTSETSGNFTYYSWVWFSWKSIKLIEWDREHFYALVGN